VVIDCVLPVDEATPNSVTFVTADARARQRLASCRAGAVVIPDSIPPADRPTIVVTDPLEAIVQIAELFQPPSPRRIGIDPRAAVDPSAVIGKGVYVGPFAVIEAESVIGDGCKIHGHAFVGVGCRLGADVEIHAHAVLYPRTVVGDRCIVHSGAVLGGDGFGYRLKNGRHQKVPQLGRLEIGCEVEIGPNTTIDRATFGATQIGDGTKIDNLVMIAHNCKIGRHNVFVSQVGIAGSSSTGDYVVMAGKAGVADHVHIGERAVLGAMAGVFTDVPAGETYLGLPARPEREAKRHYLHIDKVPEMRKQIAQIREVLRLDDAASDGHTRRTA
jgi:UDP-3-O-[3-hydroxymyristoyl] glucosamine N-acyltransferase